MICVSKAKASSNRIYVVYDFTIVPDWKVIDKLEQITIQNFIALIED